MPGSASDDRHIYFDTSHEGDKGNFWETPCDSREERMLTDLSGRPGVLNVASASSEDKYLYFCWYEQTRSDLWVMDVVWE